MLVLGSNSQSDLLAHSSTTAWRYINCGWKWIYIVSIWNMVWDISAKSDHSISPSAYVAFANMEAENACGYQGSTIDMTTVAFGQSELSTYASGFDDGPIRPLNFSDFNGCNPNGEYNSAAPFRCQPYLAFESMRYTFQPAWSTCRFSDSPPDPPFALVPGSGLIANPTTVKPVLTSATAYPITSIPALPINTQTTNGPVSTLQPQKTSSMPQKPDSSSLPIVSILSNDSIGPGPVVLSVPEQVTVASQIYTADSLSNYIINGQTYALGATITMQGTPIPLPQATSILLTSAVVVLGGQTYTAEVVSEFSNIGQPYTPGIVITMSGTPTTLASFSLIDPHSTPEVLTIAEQSYTLDPASDFPHSGQTIPSNTIITVSETPVMLIAPTLASIGPEVFIFAGNTYTGNSASNFVVGTQTLVPGKVITVSGTPISLVIRPSETEVVVRTSTQTLGNIIIDPSAPITTKGPEAFTFEGHTYTANSLDFTVGSQTLVPGSVITVSGTPISLGVGISETDIVIGTSTQNLGAIIIGPFATPTTSNLVSVGGNGSLIRPFASGAKRLVIGIEWVLGIRLLIALSWEGLGFVL